MNRSTARLTAMLLCSLCGACASNSSRWFDPDWDEAMRSQDAARVPDSAIPRTVAASFPDPLALNAEGPLLLSVEQATIAALQRNRDLRVAQLTPVIAGAFELVERGMYDPELFAEGLYSREEGVETARSTGEQFSVIGDDTQLAAGVRQQLPTGTRVEVGVTQDRSDSTRTPEQHRARVGLSVTQSLLRGFGPAINLAAIRQAELETQASLYELRGFVEALLAETEIAYWRYLLAERKIEIFQTSLELAQQQADQIAQRIVVGMLPRTEEAAARSEVALREQALIDARSELQTARLQLLRLMNLPLDAASARIIQPTSEPATMLDSFADVEDRVDLGLRLRPDLSEARLRLDQNRLEIIRTRNGLLPRLDVFVALGKTGYAATFVDSFTELDGSRTYDVSVGFNFSQFLGESEAEGRFRAAVASRTQAAAAITNLEQLVELDVRLAVNNALRAAQQIQATITTRQLQEETARAERERFDVGASTALLVAQAQRDLLVSQIAEVEAVTSYRIALVQLYLAEGSLLERRGIRVLP